VNVELHDPEHPLGGSREVYANPLASEGLVRLKSWIDHCASDHPDCAHGKSQGQTLQRFVPSRLIRLGDNTLGHVQLVSTTTPVQYVALSYCWGSTKQPGTTKSNISSQKQQIEVSELPQTLQDAIFVAKALGAHYIWIDSLCIVQDDVDDWATESSKMADVYSGAWLVIAATRANDCAEGFLQSRNEPLILDWTLPSKTFSTSTAQRTKSLKMTARLTTSHACYELSPNIADQPLAKRAWAMQERELARRIVHFLPDEILWHCQTKSCCECGLSPDSSFQKLSPFAAFSNLVPEDLERDNVVEFGMAWIDIVKSYADLKMTQLTDMLPALSGIARYIEYLQPGQYIAGVWEKDIALQLSWVRFQDLDSPRTCLSSPSFSWTSAQQNFYWHIHPFWHYKARCTFVAATKRLATKNPYGHVLECSITLRGRTIQGTKLHTRINQARIKALRPDKVFAIMDDPACSFESLLLDSNINAIGKEGISNKPSVICLELFQSKNYYTTFDINADGIVMTALVLRRYASETSYTRVGVISNINFKWFDKDGVEETVTIT
jgi:hypothetical protein